MTLFAIAGEGRPAGFVEFQYRKRYDPFRDVAKEHNIDDRFPFQYRKRYDPFRDKWELAHPENAEEVSIPQAV